MFSSSINIINQKRKAINSIFTLRFHIKYPKSLNLYKQSTNRRRSMTCLTTFNLWYKYKMLIFWHIFISNGRSQRARSVIENEMKWNAKNLILNIKYKFLLTQISHQHSLSNCALFLWIFFTLFLLVWTNLKHMSFISFFFYVEDALKTGKLYIVFRMIFISLFHSFIQYRYASSLRYLKKMVKLKIR